MSAAARIALLVAALSAGASAARADPFVVCDNGLRCVRAPCPSTNALDLGSGSALKVSGVELAQLEPREREKATRERAARDGSLVFEGAVVDTIADDAGKARHVPIFVASRILRAATAAERKRCRGEAKPRT